MSTVASTRPALTADELATYRAVVRGPAGAGQEAAAAGIGASPVHAFVLAWDALVETVTAIATADGGRLVPVVHLDQEIVLNRPLGAGQRLSATVEPIGARHHPAGTRLALRSVLDDGCPAPVAELTTGLLLVGATAPAPFGDVPAPRARGSRAWTTVATRLVPADLPARYAEVSGDHNPIHLDREQARSAGFPDVIVHGMCVLAMVCEEVIAAHAAGDATRVRGVRARFSTPVLPGDLLDVHLAPDLDAGLVDFTCRTARGTAVKRGWVALA